MADRVTGERVLVVDTGTPKTLVTGERVLVSETGTPKAILCCERILVVMPTVRPVSTYVLQAILV